MERFMLYTYREVYEASEGEYKACLKVDDEVSPGWEGGWEEAYEGDTAEVGQNQGEQAQKTPHCSL